MLEKQTLIILANAVVSFSVPRSYKRSGYRWMRSASARTRRSIVIHFNRRYHEDVVVAGWSGRPFGITVATYQIDRVSA